MLPTELTICLIFQEPVIIEDSNLVKSAFHWDLDYLEENLGSGDFSVYECDSHKFKYFDEKKAPFIKNFVPPTTRKEMKFPDFTLHLDQWKPGMKRCGFTL